MDGHMTSRIRWPPQARLHVHEWLGQLHANNSITTEAYLNLLRNLPASNEPTTQVVQADALTSSTLFVRLERRRHISWPINTRANPLAETQTNFASVLSSSGVDTQAIDDSILPPTDAVAQVTDARILSSTDAIEYRRLHRQAFKLPSPVASSMTRSTRVWRRFRRLVDIFTLRKSIRSTSTNLFLVEVRMEIQGRARRATLLLDTGSDYNILSRPIAELLRPNLDSAIPERLAHTAGGDAYTLGRVDVRWWYNQEPAPLKYVKTTFHISHGEICVDAILGWPDILKLGLVSLHPSLGFVGLYTSQPSQVNAHTVANEEAHAASRRQMEAEEMRRDAEYRRQCDEHARNQALGPANLYAQQQEALYGPGVRAQAFNDMYERAFRQARIHYARLHPQQR